MTTRKPNYFHGHRMPATPQAGAEAEGGQAAADGADGPAALPEDEPAAAPAPAPPRRPWSKFVAGPRWPRRRSTSDR